MKNVQHQNLASHFSLEVVIRFGVQDSPIAMARILAYEKRSLSSKKGPYHGLPGPSSSPWLSALTTPLQPRFHPRAFALAVPTAWNALPQTAKRPPPSPPFSLCAWVHRDSLYLKLQPALSSPCTSHIFNFSPISLITVYLLIMLVGIIVKVADIPMLLTDTA